MVTARLASTCCSTAVQSVGWNGSPRLPPTLEYSSKSVSSCCMRLAPIHGKGDKLVGLGIELTPVALGEQLGETRHRAERFLEVVRGDVGELFQLRVRPG